MARTTTTRGASGGTDRPAHSGGTSSMRDAGESRWVELLARVGLAARGLVYVIIGVLAVQIAFGAKGERADQTGALASIAEKPFGKVLLWVVALGFLGYAAWQATEAAWGHHDAGSDNKRNAERVGSAGKAVFYVFLAFLAVKAAMGSGGKGGKGGQGITAKIMSETGGRWLIGLVGLVIIGIAAYLAVEGIKKKFVERLDLGGLPQGTSDKVVKLGQAGYIARGVVTAVIGALVVVAAVTFEPKKARGLDLALRELASTGFGPWLLVAVALGLVCFGAYSFVEAKVRRL